MKEGLPAKDSEHKKLLVKDEWFTDDRISAAANEMRSAQAELDALQGRADVVHPAEMAAAEARMQSAYERMAKTWDEVSSEGRTARKAHAVEEPRHAERMPTHAGPGVAEEASLVGLADVQGRLLHDIADVDRKIAYKEHAKEQRGDNNAAADAELADLHARKGALDASLRRVADTVQETGEREVAAAKAVRALERERARKAAQEEQSTESPEQAPPEPEQTQESEKEEKQEKSAAEPAAEVVSVNGLFGELQERVRLWRANHGLAASSREIARLQGMLREKEEQLAGITGEFDLYGSEIAGIKGPYKIPDRAELQAGKDKAEIARRKALLRDEIAETKQEIANQEKSREARDAAAMLIIEKAAKRADAITRPHREQLDELRGMLDGANDHLTRYRGINLRVEQQLVEWNTALKGVRSSADKITLKTWIKKHTTLRGRLEKRIAYWERKIGELETKRDRAGARIQEREHMVDEMRTAHDQAFDAGKKATEEAEAAAAVRAAHEAATEKPASTKDFLKVWNGRFGESLPLDEHELDNLLSSSPSYREIETAAALKLGWKRGFLWKLPILSQFWNLRTHWRLRGLRSLLNNKN